MLQRCFKMYLLTLITKLFHFLPEEISHHLALSGLRITYSTGLLKVLMGKKLKEKEIPNISTFRTSSENKLGIASIKKYEEMQPGDVQYTSSDCSSLKDWIGEFNYTSAKLGVEHFVNWYKDYYKY